MMSLKSGLGRSTIIPPLRTASAYRSKHDYDEICIALFDRARERNAIAGAP